ncbi:MAG: ABC transporter ATP-binding protein, partial [Clostridia bacterium]|nr:ABC transporter ATP-binding protein [Clostridia bacterium]
ILNMLTSLQKEMNLSLLFISHEIGVVRYISHRIGVMYLGSLVEEAETEELFANTLHPYTQALFASVPDVSVKTEKLSCLLFILCSYTIKIANIIKYPIL